MDIQDVERILEHVAAIWGDKTGTVVPVDKVRDTFVMFLTAEETC